MSYMTISTERYRTHLILAFVAGLIVGSGFLVAVSVIATSGAA